MTTAREVPVGGHRNDRGHISNARMPPNRPESLILILEDDKVAMEELERMPEKRRAIPRKRMGPALLKEI
jgi:hypothetical protein